jgi:hypothetical protein
MARTWLQIRVELLGGGAVECDPPPGRVFLVGPSHTFLHLADAINTAYARWDLSHLHVFELPDGRRVGYPDEEFDHRALKVAAELAPGDAFTFVYDLGDDWRHRCRVLPEKLDPREAYGAPPSRPVPIDGWGWIPDQYGRETEDVDE